MPKANILYHPNPPEVPCNHGFFYPSTAPSNFCELDYTITRYIAEFINTLTNFAYIYFAYTTLPTSIQPQQVWIWPLPNLSLLFLGFGSGAFHATLQHSAMMVDNLGMYAVVGSLVYSLWAPDLPSKMQRQLLGLAMSGVFAVVLAAIIMDRGKEQLGLLHEVCFTCLLGGLWPRCIQEVYRGHQRGKDVRWQRRFLWQGTAAFVVGFGLWLIDCKFCQELREIREVVGLPLAWMLELHGWWHILTAFGAARFIVLVRDITEQEQGKVRGKAR